MKIMFPQWPGALTLMSGLLSLLHSAPTSYAAPCRACQPCAPVVQYAPCAPYTTSPTPAAQPTPAELERGVTDVIPSDATTPSNLPSDLNLSETFAAMTGPNVAMAEGDASLGGYIDSAIIRTRVRVRYDNARGGDSNRAEFLYGAYTFPNPVALSLTQSSPVGVTSHATRGQVDNLVQNVDFQQLSTYLEYALNDCFSGFVELPVQWNEVTSRLYSDPNLYVNDESGLGDMNAGVRVALLNDDNRFLTFQLKVLAPTGDAAVALGTGHASIMPALLFQQRSSDRLIWFGEVQDWIALGGSTNDFTLVDGSQVEARFAGNVLRFGLGCGYILSEGCCNGQYRRLTLVNEVVGWTVLDGFEQTFARDEFIFGSRLRDAAGDTIVNHKFGLRYLHNNRHAFYAGYGYALTGKDWYDNIFRLEYEFNLW